MSRSKDEELRKQVGKTLDRDKNIKRYGLNTDVVEGEAQIQGIVDTLAEKQHAARATKSVSGIKKVDNAVSVSTDGDIDDHKVEFEVAEELYANPNVDLKHIGAESNRGVVTLVGSVTDPSEIESARQSAAQARGVTKVVSQVKIKKRKMGMTEIFHSQVNNDKENEPSPL